jgi:nanoRNase/pAp phosphatase (c-di-AMP/oligoRNAs hydrolase)
MDELSRAKNSINDAKNVGILTKINANEDAMATALAIFFALKNIGKKVFFPLGQIPGKMSALLKEKEQKKIHISFNEEVSEVYYEKKNSGIDLYLVPKKEISGRENVTCETVSGLDYFTNDNSPDFDLLITIGLDEFAEVEELCKDNLDQLYACTVINIDNNLGNQNYGEINLIKDKESLSQNASCLIKTLGGDFLNREAASFLLYGLTASSKNIGSKKNIPTIKWLFKHGGDLNVLSSSEKTPSPKIKMLEEVLKNISYVEEEDIYISTVGSKDIAGSGAVPKDLAYAVEKIKVFFKLPTFLLLWESRSSPLAVKGVFYTDRRELLRKVTGNFQGTSKGMGAVFPTGESSLEAAKNKVLSYLLKK